MVSLSFLRWITMTDSARTDVRRVGAWSGQYVTLQILWILLFSAVTACGARLEIPHEPVPYTLQTLFVLLSGAFLGPVNGALSQLVYLLAGVLGAPVFAGGAFGPSVLFGPTAGYLLAFPIAAVAVGFLTGRKHNVLVVFLSMSAGLFLIFLSGTLYLYGMFLHDLARAIQSGFLIFSLWDVLKLAAATMIYREFSRRWPRLPSP
jgi:biotin transport system substrate-specific component